MTLMPTPEPTTGGWTAVEDCWRDLRYAWRALRRAPMFASVAILSLALGIGANTAIFSLADLVIFRDLPAHEPERLFLVRGVHKGGVNLVHSYPQYRDIRSRTGGFASIACAGASASPEPVSLAWRDSTEHHVQARIALVSGNYFTTLGVRSVAGRTFTVDDDRAPGSHAVAMVSYPFWKRALDGDEAAIGARLSHNGVAYQIVGVVAAGFTGISTGAAPDVWLPTMMAEAALVRPGVLEARGTSAFYVFGRLKPGATAADASTDVSRIYDELHRVHNDYTGQRGEVVPMAKGVQVLRERFEQPLLALLGIVGLLLLLACINLAVMLSARAVARRQEIAVRVSVGATRVRLLRQLMAEGVLLALFGGIAGLAVAFWAASLLIATVTTSSRPVPLTFTMDSRVLLFAVCVSMTAGILFSVLPALQASRSRIDDISRSQARSPSGLPWWRVLMAGQMAVALFLLIVAGLFVRSLGQLHGVDRGFNSRNRLVLMLDPRPAFGKDMEKYYDLYRSLPRQVEAVPGVRAASFSSASFFGASVSQPNITYEGQSHQAPESDWPIRVKTTPRFVETLGLRLLRGRTFTERDDRSAPKVGVISESIARRYFPGRNPVGQHFCFSSTFAAACAIEIVGVVGDVRYRNLREASPYTLYVPIEQNPADRGDLQVHSSINPTTLAQQIQQVVRHYHPALRVVLTTTLERLVEDSIVHDRILAILTAFFALVALGLSAMGLYGITAYGVHHRTSEIGVRLALGASRWRVQWMVIREVLMLLVIGAAVGVTLALVAAKAIRALLFDVTPTDPATVAVAALALASVTLLAGYMPARRACRVDPIQALRNP